MRKILLVLCVLLSSWMMNAQVTIVDVVFDPATADAGSLPAGMSIVDVEGTSYLQVIIDGYNNFIYIPEMTLRTGQTLACETKYVLGDTTLLTYTASQVKSIIQIMDTVNQIDNPWGEGTVPSYTAVGQDPVTEAFATVSSTVSTDMKVIHQIQFYGQQKSSWGELYYDTLYVGKMTLTKVLPDTNEFTVENVVVGAVDNPADFTCNLNASWDADSMYMNFVITDDSIVGTGTNYQIDNLEVYFDMDNSKNIHWPRNGGWMASDPTYDTNDFQLRLVADSTYTADNPITGAKVIFELSDTGYNFTLNVAWESLLEGFVGVDTAIIGFDVLISDNDSVASDAARNQITLNSPTDKPFNDPSLFATFAFRPVGRFEIIPDLELPSAPGNLVGVNDSATVTLTWDASIDNIAIMSYRIYQGTTLLGNQAALASGNRRVVNELAEGNYQFGVEAVDNYGNVNRSSINVDVVYPVGIEPALTQEFKIFPNPATSVLNIVTAGAIQNVQVISITGAVMMNMNNVDQIDLSGLKAGLYMIKVSTESDVYSTTFVRE